MPRRGLGDFSRLNIRAMEVAEALQGLAIDGIRESFLAEDTGLRLEDMSYGDFIKAFVEANESGKRDEFEAELAKQVGPLLDQMFMPQQPQEGMSNAGQP